MQLNHLSTKELADLISAANKRKKVLAKRKPAAQVKAAVNRFLQQNGWTFEELYARGGAPRPAAEGTAAKKTPAAKTAARKAVKKGGKVPPKYRNPNLASETWTGRGKQPRWMAALVAEGHEPSEFLI